MCVNEKIRKNKITTSLYVKITYIYINKWFKNIDPQFNQKATHLMEDLHRLTMSVTTRIITGLVRNLYTPSFATVLTGWGADSKSLSPSFAKVYDWSRWTQLQVAAIQDSLSYRSRWFLVTFKESKEGYTWHKCEGQHHWKGENAMDSTWRPYLTLHTKQNWININI